MFLQLNLVLHGLVQAYYLCGCSSAAVLHSWLCTHQHPRPQLLMYLALLQVEVQHGHVGREFVSLLAHHLQHCVAAKASSAASQATAVMLMNSPMVLRGCFHILLTLAAPAAAGLLKTPLRELISQLPAGSTEPMGTQQSAAAPAAVDDGVGGGFTSDPVLMVQKSQQEPVMVVRQLGGAWGIKEHSTDAATATQKYGRHSLTSADSNSCADYACWAQPPCIVLPRSDELLAGAPSSSSAIEVSVHGIPAAAGPVVRAVLVQGPKVLMDKAVQLKQPDGTMLCSVASTADTEITARWGR